ncbi:hypothetical protein K438DRAFT_1968816 [Mycena galopus ATCC 62051]|nr:hypothetical protein K438DRAFT_1968816 [Mycena galopus ATCC 62051]
MPYSLEMPRLAKKMAHFGEGLSTSQKTFPDLQHLQPFLLQRPCGLLIEPQHWTVSEESGQWMSLPQLAKKRVDVKVVGVTNISRLSPRMQALEGKFGYLLIDTPVHTADSKVTVYTVGKNQMKHDVPRKCIKPRREGNMRGDFWEMNDRVVLLGPDLESNSSRIGEYGKIMPFGAHPRGPGVIAVKFAGLDTPAFYYVSMLSLAKNEKAVVTFGTFDKTSFD